MTRREMLRSAAAGTAAVSAVAVLDMPVEAIAPSTRNIQPYVTTPEDHYPYFCVSAAPETISLQFSDTMRISELLKRHGVNADEFWTLYHEMDHRRQKSYVVAVREADEKHREILYWKTRLEEATRA